MIAVDPDLAAYRKARREVSPVFYTRAMPFGDLVLPASSVYFRPLPVVLVMTAHGGHGLCPRRAHGMVTPAGSVVDLHPTPGLPIVEIGEHPLGPLDAVRAAWRSMRMPNGRWQLLWTEHFFAS